MVLFNAAFGRSENVVFEMLNVNKYKTILGNHHWNLQFYKWYDTKKC